MTTTATTTASRGYAALRPSMVHRIRAAAAASVVVRSLLLAGLAIAVTAGGVAAGALIVAPVVARTTDAIATNTTSSRQSAPVSTSQLTAQPIAGKAQSVAATAAQRWHQLDTGVGRVLTRLPEPVARYALPTIAVLSITGALLALFLPSRESRGMRPIGLSTATPARSLAAVTPRNASRAVGKKRSPSAVEAMAASGASALDIAWRTGLPLDAVQLLLSLSTGHRQLHPPTA